MDSQKLAIYDYASKNNLKVDYCVEVIVSSFKTNEQRKIEAILKELNPQDILMVSELSRLGRSTIDLLSLVKRITAIIVQPKLRIF